MFPISSISGPFPIPATGGFAIPAPIPAGFGCSGLTAYLEWLGEPYENVPALMMRGPKALRFRRLNPTARTA